MSFIGISGEKERIKIRIGKAVFRIVVLRALLLAACKTTPLACNWMPGLWYGGVRVDPKRHGVVLDDSDFTLNIERVRQRGWFAGDHRDPAPRPAPAVQTAIGREQQLPCSGQFVQIVFRVPSGLIYLQREGSWPERALTGCAGTPDAGGTISVGR